MTAPRKDRRRPALTSLPAHRARNEIVAAATKLDGVAGLVRLAAQQLRVGRHTDGSSTLDLAIVAATRAIERLHAAALALTPEADHE